MNEHLLYPHAKVQKKLTHSPPCNGGCGRRVWWLWRRRRLHRWMARSNKYTSLNFNGYFEKKLNNNNQPVTNNPSAKSFTNQSKTGISNSRIHGHMLVLTRPTPKPISLPLKSEIVGQASAASSTPRSDPIQAVPEPDSISLRPQGRTGSAPVVSSSPLPSPVSPLPSKTDRFVPPHLRPGFVGKEEKPGPEFVKGGPGFKGKPDFRGPRPGQIQDPGYYRSETINGRPKSGGGYEPIIRGRELSDLNRPRSSGARPS